MLPDIFFKITTIPKFFYKISEAWSFNCLEMHICWSLATFEGGFNMYTPKFHIDSRRYLFQTIMFGIYPMGFMYGLFT